MRCARTCSRGHRPRRESVSGHSRLRANGHPGHSERHPVPARHHSSGPSRSGQDAHPPLADELPRRAHSDHRRMRDQRLAVGADVQALPPAGRGAGRRSADRLADARRALSREAGHARRHGRGPHRRHRSDQGRQPAPHVRGRGSDPLRHHSAHEPRHLRHQRAARPRAAHSGGAAEHPRRARPADPRFSGAHSDGRRARLQRQPGGLHEPRQHHHAAQGPHRLADPDALSAEHRDGDADHAAGSVD